MSRTASAQPASFPVPSRTFLTVKQLAAQQPALTVGRIRWDLFNRDSNGLDQSGAVIQKGRKLLLDPERYLAWLASPRPTAAPVRGRRAAA